MTITINGNGTITGLTAGGLPAGSVTDATIAGMSSSKLSGALPAISGAALTGLTAGISDFDEWYVGSSTGDDQPITSWTRSNSASNVHGVKGAGMSHSNGIWTFPSTGYWFISFTGWTFNQNRQNRYSQFRIMTTTNNSSYSEQASNGNSNMNFSGDGNGATYNSSHSQTIFDCVNTSTHKVRFDVVHEDQASNAMGGRNFTSFTVMKLGET